MGNTYWLETYGCEMNKAESSALKENFNRVGWKPAKDIDSASAIVLHTCAVRQSAEDRLWGRLSEVKAKKREEAKLCIVGCMAAYRRDAFKKFGVDLVLDNFEKFILPNVLEKSSGNKCCAPNEQTITKDSFPLQYGEGSDRLMLPIMHGCNNYCSYCIVPYLRGKEVSRDPVSIINEIAKADLKGLKELVLLGQNVNSYFWKNGDDIQNFVSLLSRIIRETNVPWIRFLTSHPKDISSKLIDILSEEPRICNHIHLPVQHGSNNILEKMNRQYSREDVLFLIDTLRCKNPDIAITTDILIGFPGEKETDFKDTLELMSTIEFDEAFTYYYNPREGTKAYSMPHHLPEEVKKRRLAEIIDLQRKISRQKKEKRLGKKTLTLVESKSKKCEHEVLGRTEWNEMVVFPGDPKKIGEFVQCVLHTVQGNTFRGEEVL
jgi:tRNA-2-methylthio-N6-dimethylallyladenosine synthase